MLCPHCGKEINPASVLGAQGKGHKKRLTDAEREVRRVRMAKAREKRWVNPA